MFGFTIFDKTEQKLHERAPAKVTEAGYVDVSGDIARIVFTTDDDDGAYLRITVDQNGQDVPFICSTCLTNSPSLDLGRLYIDGNMDLSQEQHGFSNCHNECEFQGK